MGQNTIDEDQNPEPTRSLSLRKAGRVYTVLILGFSQRAQRALR